MSSRYSDEERVALAENSLKAVASLGRRGAYTDEKGIRWDTNNADFEGYLSKKSKWMGEWRKRYFILKGSKLFFTKDAFTPPHGMIDLTDCIAVKPADRKTHKKNAIEVTLKDEIFHLFALTDHDRDDWIAKIGKAVVKNSGMFMTEPGLGNSADTAEDDSDYEGDELDDEPHH